MSKRVALVLIMVMLANMVAWAEDSSEEESPLGIILVVLALIGLGTVLIVGLAEADAPDDGMRLASMEDENPVQKMGFGSVLNLLNHVEVGETQNDKFYIGLRFQF